MTPLRFVHGERELVGMLHAPPRDAARAAGVLICAPYGQEAIRTHRLLRVLADRLARVGCHVLRFDYHGTGDSMGDDEDVTLAGCVRDVVAAAVELDRQARPERTVWIGLRLGATAAMLAAGASTRPPRRLVLCEPVLDGDAYLRSLREAHRRTQDASYSLRAWQPRATTGDDPLDAVGFAMSAAMQAELRALRIASTAVAAVPDTVVVDASGAPAGGGAPDTAVPFEWTSEEAINSALVPAAMVATLAREAIACR